MVDGRREERTTEYRINVRNSELELEIVDIVLRVACLPEVLVCMIQVMQSRTIGNR
jgi:hypothetical protein